MAKNRKKIGAWALVFAIAVTVLFTQIGPLSAGNEAFKLEGAWVAKVPGTPYQWSYVLSPDPSGRRAAFRATIDVSFPLGLEGSGTPVVGEMVKTGPNSAAFNSYWYEISDGEVVLIGRDYGRGWLIEPGILEVEHNFQFFLPDSDADGDGFPDDANGDGIPDDEPYMSFPAPSRDTRVPSP